MADEKGKSRRIYHERQRLQLCLLHSLNNLFQDKGAFDRSKLNAVAEKLATDDPTPTNKKVVVNWIFNPHHNSLTGNYDVNVLIAALEGKGKTVIWHDRRNGAASTLINLDEDPSLMGIVINVPVTRYGGLWKSRHWVTLRKIDGVWYNLDSHFTAPYPFKDIQQVVHFLDGVIALAGEVLLIMNE